MALTVLGSLTSGPHLGRAPGRGVADIVHDDVWLDPDGRCDLAQSLAARPGLTIGRQAMPARSCWIIQMFRVATPNSKGPRRPAGPGTRNSLFCTVENAVLLD